MCGESIKGEKTIMKMLEKRADQRGQGGFTLIELLVVIAILAILAGVVVFAVGNSTDSAKVSACKAEARAMSTAANATKAALLTDPSAVMTAYIDGGSLAGDFITAAETASGVTFTATARPGDDAGVGDLVDCTVPTAVNY